MGPAVRDRLHTVTLCLCFLQLPEIMSVAGQSISSVEAVQCAGDQLDISCPQNQLIHITSSSLYYVPTLPPPPPTSYSCNSTESGCQEDLLQHTHSLCSSRMACSLLVEASRTRQCQGQVHTAHTLQVIYKCIPVSVITDMCSTTKVTLTEGILASPSFPSAMPHKALDCHCSITSAASITLHLIEARLEASSDQCVDDLYLSHTQTRYCPNTTRLLFPNEPQTVYQEASISFTRKLSTSVDSGWFWFYYISHPPGQEVTLDCNKNRTSTEIIPLKSGAACTNKSLTINCKANELVYIHEAKKGYNADGQRCASGKNLCKVANDQPLVNLCSGKSTCLIQVGKNKSVKCGTQVYPENIIDVQYKCGPATRRINICSKLSSTLSEGFITSPGYPAGTLASSMDCACQVDSGDTSRASVIQMRLVEAYLMGQNGRCLEQLSIGGTTYCPSQETQYYLLEKEYPDPVTVQFKVAHGIDVMKHGYFWIRFYAFGRPLKVTCGPTEDFTRSPATQIPTSLPTSITVSYEALNISNSENNNSTAGDPLIHSSPLPSVSTGTNSMSSSLGTTESHLEFTETSSDALSETSTKSTFPASLHSGGGSTVTAVGGGSTSPFVNMSQTIANRPALYSTPTPSKSDTRTTASVTDGQLNTLGTQEGKTHHVADMTTQPNTSFSIMQLTNTTLLTLTPTFHERNDVQTNAQSGFTTEKKYEATSLKEVTSSKILTENFQEEITPPTKAQTDLVSSADNVHTAGGNTIATAGLNTPSSSHNDGAQATSLQHHNNDLISVTVSAVGKETLKEAATSEPTATEMANETKAGVMESAIIGGVIGGAVLVILFTIGMVVFLMSIMRRRQGSYHMKPKRKKGSKIPEKYSYA